MMFATNGRKESSGRTLFLIMFTLFCAGGMMLMLQAFENANHRTWADLKDKWKTLVQTSRIPPQQKRGSLRQSFGCPCLLISASTKTTQEVPS
ncbi:hypothetical protein AAZX31_18G087500 [Glycine max]